LFYRILSETSGLEIEGEHKLIGLMSDLSRIKKEYEKIEFALHEVRVKGYGIVSPLMDEMSLEEPEIVKQGSRFGVKLRASAPSIHMIRADIETEITPLVGTERQSEELVNYLLREFESDPSKMWQSNIFGKSLHELVSEGLHNKLVRMPEDAQLKLQDTLQKIINEGSGGLICIIL
jgi:stage IV sporulation protein A